MTDAVEDSRRRRVRRRSGERGATRHIDKLVGHWCIGECEELFRFTKKSSILIKWRIQILNLCSLVDIISTKEQYCFDYFLGVILCSVCVILLVYNLLTKKHKGNKSYYFLIEVAVHNFTPTPKNDHIIFLETLGSLRSKKLLVAQNNYLLYLLPQVDY